VKLPFSFSNRSHKRLKAGRFDPKTGHWAYADSAEPMYLNALTCATFNVWFGEHYFEERCVALMHLLEHRHPDLIALQEVTPPFLAGLRASRWVRSHYYISDHLGSTLKSYGLVLLSRFPFETLETHALPTRMERTLLLARIPVNDTVITIGTVHLESLVESEEWRGRQLQQIFKTFERERDVIFMGDFNFCSTWSEEQARLPPDYVDVWPALHGKPGWTEDPDVNLMLAKYSKKGVVRFDRILVRSGKPGWAPFSVELLGTSPISAGLPEVFPSDHFGLFARFQWRD